MLGAGCMMLVQDAVGRRFVAVRPLSFTLDARQRDFQLTMTSGFS
jgi:hypothetical protein